MKMKTILFILTVSISMITSAKNQKQILVYIFAGDGYVHENIPYAASAIEQLGDKHNFKVVVRNNPAVFHEDSLKIFDAVVFSNTNEQAFTDNSQRLAFKRYIQAGGSFVGIHGASTSESYWPWFVSMVGGKFVRHPKFQDYRLKIIDHSHLSTSFLDDEWDWEDECYFMDFLNPAMHVLIVADLTTVNDDEKQNYPGTTFGNYFPAAWYQYFDGGKQWYTALGHSPDHYKNEKFMNHILGGILWAIEDTKLDYSKATADKIILTKK